MQLNWAKFPGLPFAHLAAMGKPKLLIDQIFARQAANEFQKAAHGCFPIPKY